MCPPSMAMSGIMEDGCLDAHFHTQFHNNLRQGTVCSVPQPRRHPPSLPPSLAGAEAMEQDVRKGYERLE